jgi:hypothetical protein
MHAIMIRISVLTVIAAAIAACTTGRGQDPTARGEAPALRAHERITHTHD